MNYKNTLIIKNIWNVCLSIVTTLMMFTIPFEYLLNKTFNDYFVIHNWIYSFNIIIVVFFFLDPLVNYFCLKNEKEVFYQKQSELNKYYKSWFSFDVLLAFPLLFFTSGSPLSFVYLVKWIKVIFILREYNNKVMRYSQFFQISIFFYGLIVAAHLLSCIWIFISPNQFESDFISTYIQALYFSITTMTTVGFGDIIPHTNIQRLFTIFVMIFGIGMYGYLIGNITNLLSTKNPAKKIYKDNLQKLSILSNYKFVPKSTIEKIRDYYTYIYKKSVIDESELISDLPEDLQKEVVGFIKKDIVSGIPLFNNLDESIIKEIAYSLKQEFISTGNFVFKTGEVGDKMYFLYSGNLEVIKETKIVSVLKPGDYFGEIAAIKNIPRTADIRALSHCELYSLERTSMNKIINNHNDLKTKLLLKIENLNNGTI